MPDSIADHTRVDLHVPGAGDWPDALRGVTHLGVGAHADDLEFMAFHGIEQGRAGGAKFGGVIATDGAGSVGGAEDLVDRRRAEQRAAADLAGYAVMIQLGLSSAQVQSAEDGMLRADLTEIFGLARPKVIYTHNPADRHDTHVAVCLRVISALRSLSAEDRPEKVYGCEVWRDLDWLTEVDRIRLDCGGDEAFAAKLNRIFRSQIEGGKRYDLAVIGRRRAQATFDDPRTEDAAEMVTLAMDLTPLVVDHSLSMEEFTLRTIDRLRADVSERLARLGHG